MKAERSYYRTHVDIDGVKAFFQPDDNGALSRGLQLGPCVSQHFEGGLKGLAGRRGCADTAAFAEKLTSIRVPGE